MMERHIAERCVCAFGFCALYCSDDDKDLMLLQIRLNGIKLTGRPNARQSRLNLFGCEAYFSGIWVGVVSIDFDMVQHFWF